MYHTIFCDLNLSLIFGDRNISYTTFLYDYRRPRLDLSKLVRLLFPAAKSTNTPVSRKIEIILLQKLLYLLYLIM